MDIWYGPKVVIENVHRWFSLTSLDAIMVQMFMLVLTTLIEAIKIFLNVRKYFSILSRYGYNLNLIYHYYFIIVTLKNLLLLQVIIHDKVFDGTSIFMGLSRVSCKNRSINVTRKFLFCVLNSMVMQNTNKFCKNIEEEKVQHEFIKKTKRSEFVFTSLYSLKY